jgi:hypothetical protein
MSGFANAIDTVFTEFGVDATYLPCDGNSVKIRVLPRRGDSLLDLGRTQIAIDSLFFELRRSEGITPAENDCLEIAGVTYLIQAEPRIEDVSSLVWVLDTRKI